MRRGDLWLGAGWLAMTGVAVGLIVMPAAKARTAEIAEIARLRAEYSKPFNGPEVVERLTNDLSTLKQFGEGRMTPIPEESDIAGLMGSLSATLAELKLDQRDITTRTAKSLEGASVMPVAVTLFGPFERVYEAIGRIEALPRLVRVGRLRITSDDAASGAKRGRSGLVKAELTIDAFYRPTTLTDAQETRR